MPHIKVWVNGELLFQFIERTKAWDKGYFAFQQHDPGSRIEIRKIEVKELRCRPASRPSRRLTDGRAERSGLPAVWQPLLLRARRPFDRRTTHGKNSELTDERNRWLICG